MLLSPLIGNFICVGGFLHADTQFMVVCVCFSKFSNLLQPGELVKTEVSSCLPEFGSSSLSEDSLLPVICRHSPYNFLLSLLGLVVSFSKLHKGLLSIEVSGIV